MVERTSDRPDLSGTLYKHIHRRHSAVLSCLPYSKIEAFKVCEHVNNSSKSIRSSESLGALAWFGCVFLCRDGNGGHRRYRIFPIKVLGSKELHLLTFHLRYRLLTRIYPYKEL